MSKRIVTGHRDGKSVIVSEDWPEGHRYVAIPGFHTADLWATPPVPTLPAPAEFPPTGGHLPAPGATQLSWVTFPPASIFADPGFDPVAAAAEQSAILPGVGGCMEPGNTGMHATPTVDLGIVLDGTILLELDDGVTVTLSPGDVVVQNGTRHGWRNPGDRPVTMAFVMIGAVTSN
jgi:quercetin dioxygenase-like cupin family protein